MRHDEFGRLSKGLIAFKWLDGLVDREIDRHVGPPSSTVNGICVSLYRGHVNDLKKGSLAKSTFLPVLSARGVITTTTTALFMAEAVKRPILILLDFLSGPIGPELRYDTTSTNFLHIYPPPAGPPYPC